MERAHSQEMATNRFKSLRSTLADRYGLHIIPGKQIIIVQAHHKAHWDIRQRTVDMRMCQKAKHVTNAPLYVTNQTPHEELRPKQEAQKTGKPHQYSMIPTTDTRRCTLSQYKAKKTYLHDKGIYGKKHWHHRTLLVIYILYKYIMNVIFVVFNKIIFEDKILYSYSFTRLISPICGTIL